GGCLLVRSAVVHFSGQRLPTFANNGYLLIGLTAMIFYGEECHRLWLFVAFCEKVVAIELLCRDKLLTLQLNFNLTKLCRIYP
ncbi:MAG: hypothetical protein J1F40_06655, partial [Prevotellaceae bacterium]|nr:hypothetical protein [Prevotellaceae bacterium]